MVALFLSYRRRPVSTAEMGPGFRRDDKASRSGHQSDLRALRTGGSTVSARFDSAQLALALDQLAYLNSGNFFSASWVAPGNLILLPASSSTRL